MRDRWSKSSMVMHWVSLLFIAALVVVGGTMSDLAADAPVRVWLARGHTVGGVTLVLLTFARWRLRRSGKPEAALDVKPLHARGIGVIHGAIYVVIFALGLSGFATARSSSHWHEYLLGEVGYAPDMTGVAPRGVHEALVAVLLALVAAHVVGLVVQEVRKGGTLRRMVPFLR